MSVTFPKIPVHCAAHDPFQSLPSPWFLPHLTIAHSHSISPIMQIGLQSPLQHQVSLSRLMKFKGFRALNASAPPPY